MVMKPLAFKGDKPKKRKRVDASDEASLLPNNNPELSVSKSENVLEKSPDDDSWVTAEAVTDIVGPVVFVLPSDPPTCLACDSNGKVFASQLENMIERDPSTAEPHDVRQVWIASKVAGTETFSFKGHHGKCVLLKCSMCFC